MCLNILLRKIKRFAKPLIVAAVLVLCMYHVSAVEQPQVTITTGASSYSESIFFVDVSVSFHDRALYNEQVYLSYHIVDENGEMLGYENQRLPLSLDETGNAWMTVGIDASTIPAARDGTEVWIQFDLVDEQNIYWFSGNTAISFQEAQIKCDYSLLSLPPIEEDESQAVAEVPVVSVVLNCMMWVLLIVLFLWYLHREKDASLKQNKKRRI